MAKDREEMTGEKAVRTAMVALKACVKEDQEPFCRCGHIGCFRCAFVWWALNLEDLRVKLSDIDKHNRERV